MKKRKLDRVVFTLSVCFTLSALDTDIYVFITVQTLSAVKHITGKDKLNILFWKTMNTKNEHVVFILARYYDIKFNYTICSI